MVETNLLSFLHDRLKVTLKDQGVRPDIIDACLAMPGNDDLTLLVKRAEALAAFLKTDDGTNLLQGFKRANNILTQAEAKDGVEYSYRPRPQVRRRPRGGTRPVRGTRPGPKNTIAPAMAKPKTFGHRHAGHGRLASAHRRLLHCRAGEHRQSRWSAATA